MVKKGQMHVMDSMAAVMVLIFFGVAGFTPDGSADWSSYENEIAASDLSHVFKETGHLKDFIKGGQTGNIKTAISSVSERDLGVGGEIKGLPPNMYIGFHTMPSGITRYELDNVSSGDRCFGDLREINKRSKNLIYRSTSSMESGDDRIYIGNYKGIGDGPSETQYDALWVSNGNSCDIPDPDDPTRLGEVFEWNGDTLEFRTVDDDVDPSIGKVTNATLEIADAEQIKSFQQTFSRQIGSTSNNVDIDSFTLEDNTEEMDMLVFRQNSSIRRIEDGRRGTANEKMNGKPTLFLSDLNSTMLESDRFLNDKGFRWIELPLYAKSGAKCSLAPDNQEISPGCRPSTSFSSSSDSEEMKRNSLALETDLSRLSLYPGGHVTTESKGVISYGKPLYLDNFGYENVSENSQNLAMSHIVLDPSDTFYTSCENATRGTFGFSETDGNIEDFTVVNSQLGGSEDYCDRNSRAAYIDRDKDGDYDESDEGPYLNGERLEMNGVTYSVNFLSSSRPGCDIDDCLRFTNIENADVAALNYMPGRQIGRAAYEDTYSETDRKLLVSFIYMMADPTVIPSSSSGDLSTDIYGVIDDRSYKVTLRWSN